MLTVGWEMPIDEFLLFRKISVYPILVEGVGAIKPKVFLSAGEKLDDDEDF